MWIGFELLVKNDYLSPETDPVGQGWMICLTYPGEINEGYLMCLIETDDLSSVEF